MVGAGAAGPEGWPPSVAGFGNSGDGAAAAWNRYGFS